MKKAQKKKTDDERLPKGPMASVLEGTVDKDNHFLEPKSGEKRQQTVSTEKKQTNRQSFSTAEESVGNCEFEQSADEKGSSDGPIVELNAVEKNWKMGEKHQQQQQQQQTASAEQDNAGRQQSSSSAVGPVVRVVNLDSEKYVSSGTITCDLNASPPVHPVLEIVYDDPVMGRTSKKMEWDYVNERWGIESDGSATGERSQTPDFDRRFENGRSASSPAVSDHHKWTQFSQQQTVSAAEKESTNGQSSTSAGKSVGGNHDFEQSSADATTSGLEMAAAADAVYEDSSDRQIVESHAAENTLETGEKHQQQQQQQQTASAERDTTDGQQPSSSAEESVRVVNLDSEKYVSSITRDLSAGPPVRPVLEIVYDDPVMGRTSKELEWDYANERWGIESDGSAAGERSQIPDVDRRFENRRPASPSEVSDHQQWTRFSQQTTKKSQQKKTDGRCPKSPMSSALEVTADKDKLDSQILEPESGEKRQQQQQQQTASAERDNAGGQQSFSSAEGPQVVRVANLDSEDHVSSSGTITRDLSAAGPPVRPVLEIVYSDPELGRISVEMEWNHVNERWGIGSGDRSPTPGVDRRFENGRPASPPSAVSDHRRGTRFSQQTVSAGHDKADGQQLSSSAEESVTRVNHDNVRRPREEVVTFETITRDSSAGPSARSTLEVV